MTRTVKRDRAPFPDISVWRTNTARYTDLTTIEVIADSFGIDLVLSDHESATFFARDTTGSPTIYLGELTTGRAFLLLQATRLSTPTLTDVIEQGISFVRHILVPRLHPDDVLVEMAAIIESSGAIHANAYAYTATKGEIATASTADIYACVERALGVRPNLAET